VLLRRCGAPARPGESERREQEPDEDRRPSHAQPQPVLLPHELHV
jgi:hypothetical protein